MIQYVNKLISNNIGYWIYEFSNYTHLDLRDEDFIESEISLKNVILGIINQNSLTPYLGNVIIQSRISVKKKCNEWIALKWFHRAREASVIPFCTLLHFMT